METEIDATIDEVQPSLHAVVADTVTDIVDAVVNVERMIAGLTAMRAELLNEAIVLSDLQDQMSPADDPTLNPSQSMRWRSLRAEIACALRIPERTAENPLATARNLTVTKFDRNLRTLRERANPESNVERRERAVTDREVTFIPARDGMAWL